MSKRGFSLGDYLKEPVVSKTDTVREQIKYIDLDRIDPDPENFYSLEGLDELAGNIELVGLQQPLRVRPNGERFMVVSGHRRRAACLLIRDGGNPMFDQGVPCLVDYGEASDAMRELRLIFANSATRVMSSAEQSKQAERVTELLYKLKEQGVEFPGRMRDHVAEACNLSRSKIGRLQAIRGNLIPGFLAEYDAGRINESVAYRISQEETVIQKDLSEYPRAALRELTEKSVDGMIEAIKARRKPVGADPQISPPTLHKTYVDSDSLKNYLEERAEEDERYFEMLGDAADRFLPCIGGVPSRREGIEALKQKHGSCYHGGSVDGKFCWYFNAEPKGLKLEPKRGPKILRTWTEVYDLLCTIAVARLLAKDDGGPMRASAPTEDEDDAEDDGGRLIADPAEIRPTWYKGTPPRDGRYLCMLDLGLNKPTEQSCEYKDGEWTAYGRPVADVGKVVGWWPLPEKG